MLIQWNPLGNSRIKLNNFLLLNLQYYFKVTVFSPVFNLSPRLLVYLCSHCKDDPTFLVSFASINTEVNYISRF